MMILAAAPGLRAQSTEITTKEAPVTFKSGVNLVPVPVVVRDSKGRALGNLSRDDFQLSDNGKPQAISKFTIEKLTKDADPSAAPKPDKPADGKTLTDADPDGIPDRFVAYLFDDLHMSFSDMVYTRDAAKRQIDNALRPLERMALYSTSGRTMQDFTADKDKLDKALASLATGQASSAKAIQDTSCPPTTYYQGDLIYNKNDSSATYVGVMDANACANLGLNPNTSEAQVMACADNATDPTCMQINTAKRMTRQSARSAILMGERDTISALDTLRAVIGKMSAMPGQRSIVMISPGFLVLDDRMDDETRLIERAIRANIVIGGLDARGLYVQIPGGDASERTLNTNTILAKSGFKMTENMLQVDIVANLASGTGGIFYQNSNDMDEGFVRTAAAPDYLYVLGFSPLDMKLDGKYHNLKVTLKGTKGVTVQARKGYYAPKYAANPAEQAKQEIEEAFFSRDELHDLPAILQTQYFKADNGDATLSAVAKIDARKLAFRKENGRNNDDIAVLMGLFDNDGNYVTGIQKVVEMKLFDETLERRLAGGISVKTSFPVAAGRYVVRMVVRDTEGKLMASQSSLVEIK